MLRTKKQVNLTPEVREVLEQFTTTGVRSVKLLKRAKIILALDVSTGIKPEREVGIATHSQNHSTNQKNFTHNASSLLAITNQVLRHEQDYHSGKTFPARLLRRTMPPTLAVE